MSKCQNSRLLPALLIGLGSAFSITAACAGEGGTSHIMPGANATLVDLPPTSPGAFFKPMYINYRGDASANV